MERYETWPFIHSDLFVRLPTKVAQGSVLTFALRDTEMPGLGTNYIWYIIFRLTAPRIELIQLRNMLYFPT